MRVRVLFALNLKLHCLLHADITKIHKVSFPFKSDVSFMSLDDLLSINFWTVDAVHGHINGKPGSPQQETPLLLSPWASSRFLWFLCPKKTSACHTGFRFDCNTLPTYAHLKNKQNYLKIEWLLIFSELNYTDQDG